MGTALIIGGIPDPAMLPALVSRLADHFAGKSASAGGILQRMFHKTPYRAQAEYLLGKWSAEDPDSTFLDTFNEASLVLFLEHVARLEGFADTNIAMEKSRWRNLPYWTQSIWLPLDDPDFKPVVVDVGGGPTFIGTAEALLNDLREIAARSKAGFGIRPTNFDVMLNDPKTFYAEANSAMSEEAGLQWLWFAYNFAAELAISRQRLMWSGG